MNNEINIVSIARQTIQIETEALNHLISCIDEHFSAFVEAVYASTGRVIVSGIGKSALIAKKIVATLNSTGTPAIFMHASDAIHGDLGMIQKHDVVLCISKSGETAELKVLVPLIKNLGNPVAGMVSNKNSYLGQQANYLLHTPVTTEADPNNLAPTTSTTLQIVMGDAIAISLLYMRGFTPSDFAQYHPGGALGKQLYLRVRDIYIHNQKPEVQLNTSIRETIMEITSKRLGATAVINDQGMLQGIITDGDLRRMLEHKQDWSSLNAKDIMTTNPKIIDTNELAVKALETMRKFSITQLIVTDQQQYVGMIHLHDLIREGII